MVDHAQTPETGGQESVTTNYPLTGKQLRELSNDIGASETDADRADLHEKILDTLSAEPVHQVDVDLGGGTAEVLTRSLRVFGTIDDLSGRVRSVSASERESGRLIEEGLPTEMLGSHRDVREEIEAAKRRREEYIPPKRHPLRDQA